MDTLKEAMKTDGEIRQKETEQSRRFLELMSSAVSMMGSPPATPGPSQWPAYYMPSPPVASMSRGIPWPPYGVPPPGAMPPGHTSDQDDN